MSEEMTVYRYEKDLASGERMYMTTLDDTTPEGKILLYNIAEGGTRQLRECVNQELLIEHLYCDTIYMKDEETGEVRDTPRIILIDTDGNGYRATSMTVYRSMQRICNIFGMGPWNPPLKIKPELQTRGKNQMLTIKLLV